MTENKRFTIKEIDNFNYGIKVTDVIMDDGIELPQSTVCDLLNGLSDENEQLVKEKERYKRLSEIRREEINNRILTIKEFINNCSDNKVRSTLKELFYSEVNEYDLSSKYRELLGENEQLKHECNYLQNRLDDFINIQNENEQLKKDATTLIYANQDYRQQNQNLQKQLDYIQNSITNAIKHQKTELGQKALQEIIADYNEWMLGHKEAKE